jgi:hypothetical protein
LKDVVLTNEPPLPTTLGSPGLLDILLLRVAHLASDAIRKDLKGSVKEVLGTQEAVF